MMDLIRKILGMCTHDYEIIRQGEMVRRYSDGTRGVIGTCYERKCKKCGEINIKKSIVD